MRKFLIYCLLVVTISGIISFLFYKKIDVSRIKEKDLSALDYSMKSHEYNDFIFIGASRVRDQINPAIIDSANGCKCYDVSIDGMGIIECNLLLNEYLRNHPKPKAVFLNIEFNMFYINGVLYNMTDYFSYLKDSSVYRLVSPYRRVYRSKLLQLYYTMQEMFATTDWSKKELILNPDAKEINFHTTNTIWARGYAYGDGKWSVDAERILKDRMVVLNQPEAYDLLRKIIERCRKDSINLIFLYAPSYYRSPARITNFNEISSRVMDIIKQYNIPLWDYSNIPISRSTDYFADPFHVNMLGAGIYSRQIAKDITEKFYKSNRDSIKLK